MYENLISIRVLPLYIQHIVANLWFMLSPIILLIIVLFCLMIFGGQEIKTQIETNNNRTFSTNGNSNNRGINNGLTKRESNETNSDNSSSSAEKQLIFDQLHAEQREVERRQMMLNRNSEESMDNVTTVTTTATSSSESRETNILSTITKIYERLSDFELILNHRQTKIREQEEEQKKIRHALNKQINSYNGWLTRLTFGLIDMCEETMNDKNDLIVKVISGCPVDVLAVHNVSLNKTRFSADKRSIDSVDLFRPIVKLRGQYMVLCVTNVQSNGKKITASGLCIDPNLNFKLDGYRDDAGVALYRSGDLRLLALHGRLYGNDETPAVFATVYRLSGDSSASSLSKDDTTLHDIRVIFNSLFDDCEKNGHYVSPNNNGNINNSNQRIRMKREHITGYQENHEDHEHIALNFNLNAASIPTLSFNLFNSNDDENTNNEQNDQTLSETERIKRLPASTDLIVDRPEVQIYLLGEFGPITCKDFRRFTANGNDNDDKSMIDERRRLHDEFEHAIAGPIITSMHEDKFRHSVHAVCSKALTIVDFQSTQMYHTNSMLTRATFVKRYDIGRRLPREEIDVVNVRRHGVTSNSIHGRNLD